MVSKFSILQQAIISKGVVNWLTPEFLPEKNKNKNKNKNLAISWQK
jgi:hypothetical protein